MKKSEFPTDSLMNLIAGFGTLALITAIILFVISVIKNNERDTQIQEPRSSSSVSVITPDDAITKFIGEAKLSDDEQEALRNAVASDQVIIQYHLGDPTQANLDGYAINGYANMKVEYSFWAAYEYMEEVGWCPTDWSWIRNATPTIPDGEYVANIGDKRQVIVEVQSGEYYPLFRITDSYNGIILSEDDWVDYNAIIYTDSGASFLFNLNNGSEGTLHIGYDGSITWNGYSLEEATWGIS